jgi:hypothetical protein
MLTRSSRARTKDAPTAVAPARLFLRRLRPSRRAPASCEPCKLRASTVDWLIVRPRRSTGPLRAGCAGRSVETRANNTMAVPPAASTAYSRSRRGAAAPNTRSTTKKIHSTHSPTAAIAPAVPNNWPAIAMPTTARAGEIHGDQPRLRDSGRAGTPPLDTGVEVTVVGRGEATKQILTDTRLNRLPVDKRRRHMMRPPEAAMSAEPAPTRGRTRAPWVRLVVFVWTHASLPMQDGPLSPPGVYLDHSSQTAQMPCDRCPDEDALAWLEFGEEWFECDRRHRWHFSAVELSCQHRRCRAVAHVEPDLRLHCERGHVYDLPTL